MKDVNLCGRASAKATVLQQVVLMLPILDLNPSDMTCVKSVLSFVSKQVSLLHLPSACITFDQPLYSKAIDIDLADGLNIVVRTVGWLSYAYHELHGCCRTYYAWFGAGKCNGMYILLINWSVHIIYLLKQGCPKHAPRVVQRRE